jgi:hypothetical protein
MKISTRAMPNQYVPNINGTRSSARLLGNAPAFSGLADVIRRVRCIVEEDPEPVAEEHMELVEPDAMEIVVEVAVAEDAGAEREIVEDVAVEGDGAVRFDNADGHVAVQEDAMDVVASNEGYDENPNRSRLLEGEEDAALGVQAAESDKLYRLIH